MSRRRLLVARLDNAGDVLLTGPAVRAVARGATRVTYLAGPQGAEAASLLPGVHEVVTARAPWIDADPEPVTRAGVEQLVARLGSLEIDEALIFTSFHQSALPMALVLRMAGVGRVCAISTDYPGSLVDLRHCVDDSLHEVERNLSLAAAAGYPLGADDDDRLRVELPDASAGEAPLPAPYVVVHPGASVTARAWAPGRHAALVERLVHEGRRVAVTGAPAERALTAAVSGRWAGATRGPVVDLGGRTTLAAMAHLLAGADALVVGNTGPAHLAAAVGTPVVSLYAPTVPASRWRPWRVPHLLLGDQEIGCAGCRSRTCPLHDHPCLAPVTPAEVVAAVGTLAEPRRVLAVPVR